MPATPESPSLLIDLPVTSSEDFDSHNRNGEAPDPASCERLALAHRVIGKFPELLEEYKIWSPALRKWGVAGTLFAMATAAVGLKLALGRKPHEILEEITSDDIKSGNGKFEFKNGHKPIVSNGPHARSRFFH